MAAEQEVVKNPQEARQAQHAGVRYVLIFSLILVVVAFATIFFVMK